jgi:hypothetical protein
MTVTLTPTYRDTLAPETLALIDKLVEENYELSDMLIFIDEYSEVTFQDSYEVYVELGEGYGYEAVDAWLTLADADEVEKFTDAYVGEFDSPEEMAQDYLDYESSQADYRLCIDWTETAEHLLAREIDRAGNFYFRSSYYY